MTIFIKLHSIPWTSHLRFDLIALNLEPYVDEESGERQLRTGAQVKRKCVKMNLCTVEEARQAPRTKVIKKSGAARKDASEYGSSELASSDGDDMSEQGSDAAGAMSEQGSDAAGAMSEQGSDAAGAMSEHGSDAAGAMSEHGSDAAGAMSEQGSDAAGGKEADACKEQSDAGVSEGEKISDVSPKAASPEHAPAPEAGVPLNKQSPADNQDLPETQELPRFKSPLFASPSPEAENIAPSQPKAVKALVNPRLVEEVMSTLRRIRAQDGKIEDGLLERLWDHRFNV
jgi:hypothetical protein